MIYGTPDNKPKNNFIRKANNWRRQSPVLFHLLLIFLTALIVLWAMLIFLDSWTLHGNEETVPDVQGQNIRIAQSNLEKLGLEPVLSDSVFDSKAIPGTVVDQNPKPLSKVKPGRTVYLTIVAYSPKMVTVPDISNTSLRQGQSMLEGVGLKSIIIVRVPSEYEDLVLGVKCNGRELRPGEKIPINSVVTIEVGTAPEEGEMEDDAFGSNDD